VTRVDSRSFVAVCVFLGACANPPRRQLDIDPEIASQIAKVKAIDNHAHPLRPISPGEKPDGEYDALPVETLEAASDPVRARANAPEMIEARRQLFHGAKSAAIGRYGQDYAVQVLDQLGIEIMLANRVAMGPGLPSPRFRWVPFADALMYPLPTESLIHNSDQKVFFADEDRLLTRYYAESGVASRPASLEEYLSKVVRATLERHKQGGAVAEKFEIAYLRTLEIGNPDRAQAERAWAGTGDYKALQDYIFHFIAVECGRLGLAVHFHSSAGAGSYFNVSGGNPMLLEPLFNDPALRKTNFVMVHGGWPFTRDITALLTKPNVYLDFSGQNISNYPRDLAAVIRTWLEYVPEKVLFATDAYGIAPDAGWEESGYIAASTGRQALGLALSGMLRDNEITRARALELARMVLRDNAARLYGFK
jgi:predicted TIM-barrel fold metal-dependent hydrolase